MLVEIYNEARMADKEEIVIVGMTDVLVNNCSCIPSEHFIM